MHERIMRPLNRFNYSALISRLKSLLLLSAALFIFHLPAYCAWEDGSANVYATVPLGCEAEVLAIQAIAYPGTTVTLQSILPTPPYGSTCTVLINGGPDLFLLEPYCTGSDVGDINSPSGCSPSTISLSNSKVGGDCQPCRAGLPASPGAGDPINIALGNVFYQTTDYSTAGQNPLKFERYYNSRQNFTGILGTNWQTNYDGFITILSSSSAEVQLSDGRGFPFTLSGGAWTTDTDVDYTLTASGTATTPGTIWTLTGPDDTVDKFTTNSHGTRAVLNSITARNGYAQTLNYTSGVLSSVSDSYSRSITFTVNSAGLLTGITTPDSTTITFGYSGSDITSLLTSVTFPTSPSTSVQYAYGAGSAPASALTSVTDENGNTFETWTYDGYGRGLTNAQGGSSLNASLVTVTYNDTTGSRTVTNALGVTDTYTFSVLQGVPKVSGISRAATSTTAAATETIAYDSNGYLNSLTDWNGNQTTYVNNVHGLPTTINEAVGTSVARTTTIAYDTTWVHLPDSITTPGLTTSFTYQSGTGNVLTKTLTDTTTGSTPYSTHGQTRTWTYTWTSSDTLLDTRKTPNGNTTTLGYNSGGALTSITDPLSHVTNITSVTNGGRPLTIVDPNSVTTTLTYNPRQWLLTSSVSTSGGARTTTYTYDAAGNLTKTTLPDSSYLANTYDTAHRITKVTDALGNYVSYTLDALGDRTQESTYNSSATQTKNRTRTFDALARTLTDTGVTSETTTYTWDKNGNALTVKDGNSHTTTNLYDALNRLYKITNAVSGVTQYVFDPHDQVTSLTDPNTYATTWTRDGFEEAIQEVSPDRGTTVYHYDSDGNLTQKVDASRHTMNQTFDALDRPLTTTYPADSTLSVSYTYDQTTGHGKGIGRLTSVTDQAGSLSRSYDELANLLTDVRTISSTNFTTTYTYDPANRIASITYPAGTLVTYSHDAQGNVSNVAATPPGGGTAVNLASSITHMPFGPMKAMSFFNSASATYTYDQDYRVTAIDDITHSGFTWDNAYNVTAQSNWTNAPWNISYTYDALNRMTNANAPYGWGSISYTFDANGNQLTGNGDTFSYTSGTNRQSQKAWTDPTYGPQTETASYTATGNVTSLYITGCCSTFTATYNSADQVATEFNRAGATTTNSYDFKRQRTILACCGSPSTYFTYDQGGTLLEQVDNGFYVDYIYLDGRLIGLQENSSSSTALYSAITYLNGGVAEILDSGKNSVWGDYIEPYGYEDGIGGTLTTQSLRFPGQFSDSDFAGINYNLNRYYNTATGRYIQADPIGLAGGINPYVYAGNNPVTNTDSLGLQVYVGFPYPIGGGQYAAPPYIPPVQMGSGYVPPSLDFNPNISVTVPVPNPYALPIGFNGSCQATDNGTTCYLGGGLVIGANVNSCPAPRFSDIASVTYGNPGNDVVKFSYSSSPLFGGAGVTTSATCSIYGDGCTFSVGPTKAGAGSSGSITVGHKFNF